MSRPPGTEAIDDHDIAQAFATLTRNRTRITRHAVATEAGYADSGLRDYHRRRGMSWADFRASFTSVPRALDGVDAPDDPCMRSLMVPTDPDLAEALRTVARRELRHPRQEAALLIREGLERRGVLPRRDLRDPSRDQAA